MKLHLVLVAAIAVYFSANCQASVTAAEACTMDLEAIPGFLLENDAGAKDHVAFLGQEHFDHAFAKARDAAAKVQDMHACSAVLNQYTSAWRKGHLGVADMPVKDASDKVIATTPAPPPPQLSNAFEPRIRILSNKTLVLTLDSFRWSVRDLLPKLIKQHRKELSSHPNWIIDVRRNDGGADSSYESLLPWLISDESTLVSTEWLSTPANIAAIEQSCGLETGGDEACKAITRQIVEKMHSVNPGKYVANNTEDGMLYMRYRDERHRPSRVAILIDHPCGSACEQFLLEAKQSYRVKLLGRRTFGALDYSNLCPFVLPSGQRELWYAISRSKRIPNLPVDAAGILPDIYLPPPTDDKNWANEIVRVRHWLEGGSLAPDLHLRHCDLCDSNIFE